MNNKQILPLPPVYNELLQLLFMLQMSYINHSSVNVTELISKIDELVSVIHAHNILERTINN